MGSQTDKDMATILKLMRQKADLMEKNNKLLKEQNEMLKELIKRRKAGHYISLTDVFEKKEVKDVDGRDICDACGHKDALEYCMHCEYGTMWIPKEDENGGE